MAEGNKMDLTAKLPDEILMEVFDHLSLRDKLHVESVSRRFQRCLVQLLNTKPIPLDIDLTDTKLNQRYVVPRKQLWFAVQTLANKAKFNSIDLRYPSCFAARAQELDLILSALVSSDNNCLEKVTKFEILSSSPVSEALLTEVFAKCVKLTDVLLNLPNEDMKKIGLALKDKTLTQLSVTLRQPQNCSQKHLIALYQPIKPNTLKKIKLFLLVMSLDIDQLVNELFGGAWAALEVMELECIGGHMQMGRLFSTIRNLPALRKCTLERRQVHETPNQLVAALTSLFTNQIEITVSMGLISGPTAIDNRLTGCELVSVIRQVRAVHPDLRVDFVSDPIDFDKLRLTLDKVSFQRELEKICHPNCNDCGIFYPTLIVMLKTGASDRVRGTQQDVHLTSARLDRCRVDTVVAHLNKGRADLPLQHFPGEKWKAVHAEMNEAQNLATITFESTVIGQFQITVDCGHCLTNGCFRQSGQ